MTLKELAQKLKNDQNVFYFDQLTIKQLALLHQVNELKGITLIPISMPAVYLNKQGQVVNEPSDICGSVDIYKLNELTINPNLPLYIFSIQWINDEPWIRCFQKEIETEFISTKIIDGFSACFRQWKAEDTHCKFLHGYSIYFTVKFKGQLDFRNWVNDFGFMKRSKNYIGQLTVDEWFKYMFDHTTVVAVDDPALEDLKALNDKGVIQLRILKHVGCERFAELVFHTLNDFIKVETNGRVRVIEVECHEHSKNSAIFTEQ